MKRVAAALLASAFLLIAGGDSAAADPVGHYREFGDAGGFMNILPPGTDGVLSVNDLNAGSAAYGPHAKDQLAMYSDLVYKGPALPDNRLSDFYKDASFGVPQTDIARVYSPTPGVTVMRDRSFGVPHIFGSTRYATMFAQGYTAAEDRLFLMDVLRHLGRARLSEFLGNTPSNQSLDRGMLADAPYTEADLTDQISAMQASGPKGAQIVADGAAYVDGVNAYITEALSDNSKLPAEYNLLGITLQPWVAEDTIAVASQVGAQFGKGGGGEVSNFCGLKSLTAATGNAATARAIFDDLHFANDAEAPTTSPDPAPYMTDPGPVDPAAHPDIDCASLDPVIDDTGGGFAASSVPTEDEMALATTFGDLTSMSNALLVSGAHTATGAPIAIFGPQTGYFMPQLLIEKDVHGPGIDARGAAFAGVDIYVQLGRGARYAWSATSSGADNVDQWVLELCEPGGGTPTTASMGYMHDGTCEAIETYQHVENTTPQISWRVERTPDYGPISERGTLVDGTPIAIASLRSTYGFELESARGFYRVNDPAQMSNGFGDFRTAMGGGSAYTFNWFYIDAANIGYQHSCKCPQRHAGVDPYLPAWGNGDWDWQGYIAQADQPWALNPAQGYLVSWNNKQAPQFTANDRNFGFGPVYRSQMLESRIQTAIAGGGIDRAQMVDIMEDAGTVDLRGQEDLPLLLQVMGPTAPGGSDPRVQDMRDRLVAWMALGAHRLDKDHNGIYDDPQAPAIMDAWWSPLLHAMFDASSSNAINTLGISLHDAPQGHSGSAFAGGMYSHVQKDLRQVLSLSVTDPFSQTYCGGGSLTACRAALWSSLEAAASTLQSQFGSALVADWKRTVSDDDVRSQAIGVASVPAFHWVNRPTFQQLVQINAGCSTDADCDTILDPNDNCPAESNTPQVNDDADDIDLPGKAFNDLTRVDSDKVGNACDPDDDNDGLPDLTEASPKPCAAATGPTNPALADSDGDLVLDGAECALGFNPLSNVSKPSFSQCTAAAAGDADGDGLLGAREFCNYGTNDRDANTDGDTCGDAREVASINVDQVVNAIDLGQIAASFGPQSNPSYYADFDFTRDGTINAIDLGLVAGKFGPCP